MHLVSGDAEIAYRVRGDGPSVVLLHPFPAHYAFWSPAADLLDARYRLVLPDLRGHGDSSPGEGPATMEKHATDLVRLCDAAGIGRAVFAGVSIGGYVLFEFWRRYRERVAALVLCDTRAGADSEEGRASRLKSAEEVEKHGPVSFIDSMLPKLLGETTRSTRPDLVEAVHKMMLKMTVAGITAVQRGMAARPDSAPTLRTIDVPTLILVGSEDALTPVSESELMQQAITGSRMEVVPRGGHYAIFEQHEPSVRLLRNFLDALKSW